MNKQLHNISLAQSADGVAFLRELGKLLAGTDGQILGVTLTDGNADWHEPLAGQPLGCVDIAYMWQLGVGHTPFINAFQTEVGTYCQRYKPFGRVNRGSGWTNDDAVEITMDAVGHLLSTRDILDGRRMVTELRRRHGV